MLNGTICISGQPNLYWFSRFRRDSRLHCGCPLLDVCFHLLVSFMLKKSCCLVCDDKFWIWKSFLVSQRRSRPIRLLDGYVLIYHMSLDFSNSLIDYGLWHVLCKAIEIDENYQDFVISGQPSNSHILISLPFDDSSSCVNDLERQSHLFKIRPVSSIVYRSTLTWEGYFPPSRHQGKGQGH